MKYMIASLAAYVFFILPANAQVRRQGYVPDRLLFFQCSLENGKAVLSWSITNNNVYNYFEVQRSDNGKDFTTAGMVFATEKPEIGNYTFKSAATDSVLYYRLKLMTVHEQFSYSKIIVVRTKSNPVSANNILLLQNPVQSSISFKYHAAEDGDYKVAVYTASGIRIHGTRTICTKGANIIMILPPGLQSNSHYILEVSNDSTRSTTLFLKQ